MNGNAYIGQQGTGLATVVGDNKSPLLYLQQKQARDTAKAKEREDALAKMQEVKPDEVWHYYSQEANNRWQDWMKRGGEMMTKNNIPNPWKSSHPDAIQWQIEGANLKAATQNINQYKKYFDEAMKDIGTRGKDYDSDYLAEVENFAVNHSFEALAAGQASFPQSRFKNPTNYFNGFVKAQTTLLKSEFADGILPPPDRFKDVVNTYFSAPDEENVANATAAMQMYDRLPDDIKSKYDSQAQLLGLDSGWKALAYQNLTDFYGKPQINLAEESARLSKMIGTDEIQWSTEDVNGVTVFGKKEKIASKDAPKRLAESFLNERSYLLDDPTKMGELGVSMNLPLTKRRAAAIQAMAKQIEDQVALSSQSGVRRDGRGASEKEVKESKDRWLRDIQSPDLTLANQAAKWVFGTKGEAGLGEVTDARIIKSDADMPLGTYGTEANRVLIVEYSDDKSAQAALEKFIKESDYGKEASAELMNLYKAQSNSKAIYYPVSEKTMQILGNIHDRTAKQVGKMYEPMRKVDPAGIFDKEEPQTKSRFKLRFNE